MAGVPDVEGRVEHVGLLQLVQLVLVVPELTVQGPAIGQDVKSWSLIGQNIMNWPPLIGAYIIMSCPLIGQGVMGWPLIG